MIEGKRYLLGTVAGSVFKIKINGGGMYIPNHVAPKKRLKRGIPTRCRRR